MKVKMMTIEEISDKIAPILNKNGVFRTALFGSYARGEATITSDIDLLVEMKKPQGLFFTIGLKLDLEKRLGKKVDLVTPGAVNSRLKKYIDKDVIEIYHQRTY